MFTNSICALIPAWLDPIQELTFYHYNAPGNRTNVETTTLSFHMTSITQGRQTCMLPDESSSNESLAIKR